MIPVQLIVAGAIAVASFGAAWTYQGNRYEAKLAERETDHALALAKSTADALAKTVALQEKANAAERKHQSRLVDLRRDIARVRTVADGLRNDLSAARSALPTASPATVLEYASTLATVSTECGDALVEMAGNAESHRLDAMKLLEAWPSAKP